jgi:hypothetical protein
MKWIIAEKLRSDKDAKSSKFYCVHFHFYSMGYRKKIDRNIDKCSFYLLKEIQYCLGRYCKCETQLHVTANYSTLSWKICQKCSWLMPIWAVQKLANLEHFQTYLRKWLPHPTNRYWATKLKLKQFYWHTKRASDDSDHSPLQANRIADKLT